MKRTALLLIVSVCLTLAGCVPSLNPLYTEKDLTFDPALVGVWSEQDDSQETWAFEKAGEKQYKLVYTDKGKTGEFEVRLLKLGGTLYLDLFAEGDGLKDSKRNDFYLSHFIPGHTFAKVTQIGPTLRMAFMNPDWLKKLLEKDPKAIGHQLIGEDRIVLTAPTRELQEFVLKHAKEAFGSDEPSDLKRIKPKP